MLGAAFTTAQTLALTSASAATRSRSTWSMMAMSPGRRRLVSRFVRRSIRAGPATPGGRSPPRGRRKVASLITAESARPAPPGRTAAPPLASALVSARFIRRRDLEQLLRVAAPEGGLRQPSQHAGELLESLGAGHVHHASRRRRGVLGLPHDEVMVGEGSDLWQRGHDDPLRRASECGEPPAPLHCRVPADAGVDLVEDE